MRKLVFSLDKVLDLCPQSSFDKLHWGIDITPEFFSIKKCEIGHIKWSIPFNLEIAPIDDPRSHWYVSYILKYNVEKFYNAKHLEKLDERKIETVTMLNSEDRIVKISKIIFHNNDIFDDVKKRVHEKTLFVIKNIIRPQQYIKTI